MCSCHSILECCVMFSGVKLSVRSFVLFIKPYQLKPKRGQETFTEPPVEKKEVPPPSNARQIKHMKKTLGKLNKKIRHSKKKRNNLVSK